MHNVINVRNGVAKQKVMDSNENEMEWSTSPALEEPKEQLTRREKIFSKRKILNYETSQSFISFVESNGMNDIREKLKHHLTQKIKVRFLNGIRGEIEYNFNPARRRADCVLINVRKLSPLFGGIVPAAMEEFTSIFKINNFIETHVHLNECSYGVYASCSCGKKRSEDVGLFGDVCKYGHVHHFCSEHLRRWFECYLHHTILLRESMEHYKDLVAQECRWNPEDIIYLQTGDRATPQYWLKAALEGW